MADTNNAGISIAYKHFDSHFGGFVNVECACGGNPGRCNTGKMTLARTADASSGSPSGTW